MNELSSEQTLAGAASRSSSGLTLAEKFGYGLGDTASNLVFQVLLNYMLIFYTDVFGIGAAAAGTMMLIVRCFDAFTDPVMGVLADRTETRWGRYRPYLVVMALPYAALAVIAFITPDWSANGKLIYAYVSYTLLTLVYTAINIPYSALGGMITADKQERASVQAIRFVCAMFGGVIVTAFMMDWVQVFGQGDEAKGFPMAMAALSGIAVVCFLLCFWTTRERVTAPKPASLTIKADIVGLLRHRAFLIVLAIAVIVLITVSMRGAVTPYYVEYVLGRKDLVSRFLTAGMIASVGGALFTFMMIKYVPKRYVFLFAVWGLVGTQTIIFFMPIHWITPIFILSILTNFFHMVVTPLMFSMVPDAADEGEKSLGKNIMAMAFSLHLLAIKFGLAIGAALTGWILAASGYIANAVQTESAVTGIIVCFAIAPATLSLMLIGCMRLYSLDKPST